MGGSGPIGGDLGEAGDADGIATVGGSLPGLAAGAPHAASSNDAGMTRRRTAGASYTAEAARSACVD